MLVLCCVVFEGGGEREMRTNSDVLIAWTELFFNLTSELKPTRFTLNTQAPGPDPHLPICPVSFFLF